MPPAWPDSMLSSQRGSSPKVSHTHAEGLNASSTLRPSTHQGPSVRERKVSLQRSLSTSPGSAPQPVPDRKPSPGAKPVKEIVSELEARGGGGSPIKHRSGANSGEDSHQNLLAKQPSSGKDTEDPSAQAISTEPLFPTTNPSLENPDRANKTSGDLLDTKEPAQTTVAPTESQQFPQQAAGIMADATSSSQDPKPTQQTEASSNGNKEPADTAVLSTQLSQPETKDPPLSNEEATTKPSSEANVIPADKVNPDAQREQSTTSNPEEQKKQQEDSSQNKSNESPEPSALDKIEADLDKLPVAEQQRVSASLSTVKSYPPELPLTRSWCFYWSDTSAASSSKSRNSSVKSYTSGMVDLFEADNVPQLCGALKALKLRGRPQNGQLHLGDYGLHSPGQNIHVFRKGVAPVWEDPWSEKGGRFTLSPPGPYLEVVLERLILGLVGSAFEIDCGDGGAILGIVGSRRSRGDRLEVWVGGNDPSVPPTEGWVEKLRQRVSQELETTTTKYKSHFS